MNIELNINQNSTKKRIKKNRNIDKIGKRGKKTFKLITNGYSNHYVSLLHREISRN